VGVKKVYNRLQRNMERAKNNHCNFLTGHYWNVLQKIEKLLDKKFLLGYNISNLLYSYKPIKRCYNGTACEGI